MMEEEPAETATEDVEATETEMVADDDAVPAEEE